MEQSADVKIGDVVAVEWEDAWIDHTETSEEDWKDECLFWTFGIVVGMTQKKISVAMDVRYDAMYRSVAHIPWSIVKEIYFYATEARSDTRPGAERIAIRSGNPG